MHNNIFVVKYYFFASQKDISIERFNDALHSAYKNIFAINFFDAKSGYMLSDEYFYDSLETLIPVIMSDTDNTYTIVMCNDDNQIGRLALKKASHGRSLYLTDLADLILDLALEGDYELVHLAKKQYATVPRQLMVTAETFVSCGLNASLAAKKLYVHRNTFSYRLNQFIEATNLDIRDYHNAQFFNIINKLIGKIQVG